MSTTSIACPNCGAPAQVALGQTSTLCTFCHQPFQVAPPPPPPPAQPAWPQQQFQPIVIVPPGGGDVFGTPAAAVAAFTGMRILFAVLPVVIIAFVGGVTWFTSFSGAGIFGGGWNGSGPLVCGGNDSITATGVSVSFSSGSAVDVEVNCHFKCTRCTLKAPIGVMAGGNGQVDLIDTRVEGSQNGVIAGGNSGVRMLGSSSLVGDVTTSANASVTAPPGAKINSNSGFPFPPGFTIPASPPRSNPSPAAPNPGLSRRH